MKTIAILLAAGAIEVLVLGYVAYMTYLRSGWFLDDSVAFGMSPADWRDAAAQRLAAANVVASLAAVAVHQVNRRLAKSAGASSSRLPMVSAAACGAIILAAGVVGSVQFAIEKPFM